MNYFGFQEMERWRKRDQKFDAVLYYWLYEEVCVHFLLSGNEKKKHKIHFLLGSSKRSGSR